MGVWGLVGLVLVHGFGRFRALRSRGGVRELAPNLKLKKKAREESSFGSQPKPQTLNPKPQTPNPKPQALNPKP